MTGEAEKVANELERIADHEADYRLAGFVLDNLPLILRHLRAGSDAAVERAAILVAKIRSGAPPCSDQTVDVWDRATARAAIRAAVEP